MRKIAFIIPPDVELLDLAGPVQVFTEAISFGLEASLAYYSFTDAPVSTSGLSFGVISHFDQAALGEGDFIFVPGMNFDYVKGTSFGSQYAFFHWLRECANKKTVVCAVCNGAYALANAGLLDGIECTTHWRRVQDLQTCFPKAKVQSDRLFVKSGNIYTSAGISAGIDLALSILEDLLGPLMTHKVARSMVVYHRRSGKHRQQSIYLDYRNHIHPQVHEVQDYLIQHLEKENSITTLAAMVNMSPRNLSRVFKEATGCTVLAYHTLLRREFATTMLNNPEYTLAYVARQCGFKSIRQLQRILKSE